MQLLCRHSKKMQVVSLFKIFSYYKARATKYLELFLQAKFSIDGVFVNTTSELPDITTQNITKVCQKSHRCVNFTRKKCRLVTLNLKFRQSYGKRCLQGFVHSEQNLLLLICLLILGALGSKQNAYKNAFDDMQCILCISHLCCLSQQNEIYLNSYLQVFAVSKAHLI